MLYSSKENKHMMESNLMKRGEIYNISCLKTDFDCLRMLQQSLLRLSPCLLRFWFIYQIAISSLRKRFDKSHLKTIDSHDNLRYLYGFNPNIGHNKKKINKELYSFEHKDLLPVVMNTIANNYGNIFSRLHKHIYVTLNMSQDNLTFNYKDKLGY